MPDIASLPRRVLRPGILVPIAFVIGVILVERWVRSIGGPDVLLDRFGWWGPVAAIPIQSLLAAAPVPSELFTVAAATAYGWVWGSVVGWAGWTVGSMLQYAMARRGAADVALSEARRQKLPAWIRRFPVEHPAFLICVRWLPMGFHVVNVSAGARGISLRRHLWTAAVGSAPGAMIWAAVGASIAA